MTCKKFCQSCNLSFAKNISIVLCNPLANMSVTSQHVIFLSDMSIWWCPGNRLKQCEITSVKTHGSFLNAKGLVGCIVGGGFNYFFIFILFSFPIWLIFLRLVETTNYHFSPKPTVLAAFMAKNLVFGWPGHPLSSMVLGAHGSFWVFP